MKELLQFIAEHLLFLMESFRFVDSRSSAAFGGNACIILKSENVRIRLIRERLKLYVEFQSSYGPEDCWYDWDVIREMVLQQPVHPSLLDSAATIQLEEMLPILEDIFSIPKHESTENVLKGLERERSRRLFGI
jgi:hypothetical protein